MGMVCRRLPWRAIALARSASTDGTCIDRERSMTANIRHTVLTTSGWEFPREWIGWEWSDLAQCTSSLVDME